MDDGRWLRAGRVGRPHGLDGSFHVTQASPRLLELGMSVVIGSAGDGGAADAGAEEPARDARKITRRAGQETRPIIAVEGCDDRQAASALQGCELLAAREGAPALPDDEWWVDDLEGCTVRDGERIVGTVTRMLALPSVDVLEVSRTGEDADLLVPLVDDAVRTVDVGRKEIQVNLEFLGQD